MTMDAISRRSFLKQVGATGALAYSTHAGALDLAARQAAAGSDAVSAAEAMQAATRAQRMAWWRSSECSSTGACTAYWVSMSGPWKQKEFRFRNMN